MKILSFDVGMKNLAFCLFECNPSLTSDFKIISWDVINLCSTQITNCNYSLNSNSLCNSEAKYCKNNNYYCKKHAKFSNLKIPSNDLDIKKLSKKKLCDISSVLEKLTIQPENSFSCENSDTLPKKSKNSKEKILDTIKIELESNYLDFISKVRADQVDLITLGKNMASEMNKFVSNFSHLDSSKHSIDIVIIENQISTIASRMKTLQGMIAQYFIMQNTPTIEFISSTNKLKLFQNKDIVSYTDRKQFGIHVCKNLLKINPQFHHFQNYLDNNKKKDDLADSFLQGIFYLIQKNLITLNTNFQ